MIKLVYPKRKYKHAKFNVLIKQIGESLKIIYIPHGQTDDVREEIKQVEKDLIQLFKKYGYKQK